MSVIDNALQACFKESVKVLKKWTNASPASSFAAQKISIDLSGFDGAFVGLLSSTTATSVETFCFCEIGKGVFPVAQPYYLRTRKVTADKTGVTFDSGTRYDSSWSSYSDNGVAIPAEIYAVKFIMGGVIHKLKTLAASLFTRREVLE